MCGIVGYIGKLKATDVILNGLKKLEYRGYDSCGISFLNEENCKYVTYKTPGRVDHLINSYDYKMNNFIGIGHTRWATHGEPNQVNSHPHSSASDRFIVVHNGVIDNYKELTARYLQGFTFISETDTEVIADLIENFAKTMSAEEAIRKTLSLLEGSYALLIMDKEKNDTIYAAKNKSPLLLGSSDKGVTFGSDLMALVGNSEYYYLIEDKTFIVAQKNGKTTFQAYDIIGKSVKLQQHKMDLADNEIDKGGYEHFMLKEISEQPAVIRRIISKYLINGKLEVSEKTKNLFKNKKRIYILAAGTSMHAGFIGRFYFENLTKIPTEVFIASEFAYNPPLLEKDALFVLISQSGETADLRACLVNVKRMGYEVLTITNVITSTLAREADHALEIYAGPEIAVASTKAYVAQVTVLAILAYVLSEEKPFDLAFELSRLSVAMEAIIDKKEYIEKLVEKKLKKRNCFYIGRGIDYYTSLEAALKLKEISYIQTEGFAAGELKHGTIALIEKDVPVIAIISQKSINHNTRSNIQEVRARGAKTIIIATEAISDSADDIILSDVHEFLSPLLTVIPTQLIAYYKAKELKLDIDKPRNLAKSVTVE
ncbi:MAG: glutamine--fructose-6-phosphate transaminase (isomerizing) [Candidatus Izemoplasmatales bacterium]|jgi:glucosamine--fructose-6-phosphate aminotransferase (isomerizing)|nr:glutamine--fructose-6-phosphate transaminase (isomerizing) [Candidatus Izemoplasmatales bacterium]